MKNKIPNKEISSLIKHMREISGYSQIELAKKLGIAQTTLSGYETNYSEPNFVIVLQIADICDFEIICSDKSSNEKFRAVRNK